MSFPYNVFLLALLSGALTTAISVPWWRNWCRRYGVMDEPGAARKLQAVPVPLAGGLAVMTGLAVPLIAAVLFAITRGGVAHWVVGSNTTRLLEHGFEKDAIQIGAVMLGALGMLLIGFWDDKFELRPAVKFGGQLLVALVVAAAGVRITLFVPSHVFSYAITILWILTVVNAFNFMDNMNGLCVGLGIIGAWYFGIVTAINGQYLVATTALLITGALAGFLPYNFPKASAFLGDAGSHLVGYLLSVLAILPHFYTVKHPEKFAVLTPLLALGVPLGDLVWVVILRWKLGKPFYIGDTNHLSHRLVRRGWSRTRAVLMIWLLAALLGAAAFVWQ
jgi:UDP-GlcNAc:undecaprenyl-phosphate/decaprenyl-phosphate GlcNAc-1-phosphate transferase